MEKQRDIKKLRLTQPGKKSPYILRLKLPADFDFIQS